VPYTRGPEYSRSLAEVLSEANQLVDNGSKEIILLGQNVNAYDYNSKRLSDLLIELEKIKGLQRIRYTTSHPNDLTDDLIEAHVKCKKLMPLLHLPVQSGSTKILKNMNRNHTADEYLKKIEKLKKRNPSIKFSSDFIIAYPGETENEFQQTISLMKKVKFINSYSFIFSPRPGTPSASLKRIDSKIAKNRLSIFQKTADEIKKNYRKKLINTTTTVLFENKNKNERSYFGRDEYFNSVIVKSNENLIGQTKKVKINQCNQNTLFGEIILDPYNRSCVA
jgi:tRNA-2-methylthio-N6-dimethylallyladenosine synthase